MLSIFTRAGACAALVFTLAGASAAHEYKAGSLLIKHPWMRATPGGADVAAGYLSVVNTGPADRLLGGSLEGAKAFELHDMSTSGGVMTMRPSGPVDVPAVGTLTLAPAGRHIMFTGLAHGFAKGAMVPGTLVFEHAGTVAVQFAVEAIGAKAPAEGGGHGMPDMPSH